MHAFDKKIKDRYHAQSLFEHIGIKGQKRLAESKAVVVGCGGLGSVIANNLARAGIGFIKLIDKDYVEINNLSRQVLFNETDAEKETPKSLAAKKWLESVNSEITIEAIPDEVNKGNIGKYISNSDLVLDGTDNFKTRFLINDTCVRKKIPWIYGSVAASYGMVCDIIPGRTPCFRCMFTEKISKGEALSSSNVGVINPAVNVVASIQTVEALKILTGNIDDLVKGIIYLDIWNYELEVIDVKRNENFRCPICGS